ncbi:MAG TPA: hypothetical protein VFV37_10110 [Luteibaculaceae bacterium]|nr:hypothetical protein [Luteibaculaceae bacterium]
MSDRRINIFCTTCALGIFLLILAKPLTAQDNSESWLNRVSYGGDFNVVFGRGFLALNLSPVGLYKLTDRLSAGAGLIYQYQRYDKRIYGQTFEVSTYGGRILGRYRAFDKFFAHAELQVLNLDSYNLLGEFTGRATIPMFFAGGGYLIPAGGKAYIAPMVLFDLIDDSRSPYQNPLIQIGIIINP